MVTAEQKAVGAAKYGACGGGCSLPSCLLLPFRAQKGRERRWLSLQPSGKSGVASVRQQQQESSGAGALQS